MEVNNVTNHIDRKIIEFLESNSPDPFGSARLHLMDNMKNYINQLEKDPKGNSRRKMLSHYISHARRRINSLYFIQNDWSKFTYPPRKTFELLLLREKLGNYNL